MREEPAETSSVSVKGIFQARKVISRFLKPTPLIRYPLLSRLLGCEAYVKHENHNPTGSFKIRGGLNLISSLTAEEKARGVITATRGNHGQSVALASSLFGISCVIAVPHGNNPEKNEAMEAYGAELLVHGKDFDEARERVEELRQQKGMRYIHSANEPLLVHGVGTYALEILEELPELDYVFVPVGGGSGASGLLTVMRSMARQVRVVGVQAEQAPAVYLSWRRGEIVQTESAETIADGLATRIPFELTFSIIRESIDQLITVTEEELEWAVGEFFRTTHNVAEPAGASVLSAAWKIRKELEGRKVVLILSGSNISTELFEKILRKRVTSGGSEPVFR